MVNGVGSTGSSSNTNAVVNALSSNQFVSENTFLQLLITQLKNQNPLNPQDSSQFVAQLAQFSSVEQMTQMNQGLQTVLENSATSLIGQSVTVLDPNQGLVSGKVTGIVYFANGPAVQVNGVNYPLSAVQNVGTVNPNAPNA